MRYSLEWLLHNLKVYNNKSDDRTLDTTNKITAASVVKSNGNAAFLRYLFTHSYYISK